MAARVLRAKSPNAKKTKLGERTNRRATGKEAFALSEPTLISGACSLAVPAPAPAPGSWGQDMRLFDSTPSQIIDANF